MGQAVDRFRKRSSTRQSPSSGVWPRLVTAVVMLGIVGLMISTASDPANWTWLSSDKREPSSAIVKSSDQPPLLVPGPTDLDAAELAAAKIDFAKTTDNEPLLPREMPTYWRFLRWSLAQKPEALRERARSDLLFTHLWEAPAKYRGQLLHLDLHARRSLAYETTASVGVPKEIGRLFEISGATDESKTNPYILVVDGCPPGFPIAANIAEEISFDGYFLKLMAYRGGDDKPRAAPLLVGRMRWLPSKSLASRKSEAGMPAGAWVFVGCTLFLAVRWLILPRWFRWKNDPIVEPAADRAVESWLRGEPENPES